MERSHYLENTANDFKLNFTHGIILTENLKFKPLIGQIQSLDFKASKMQFDINVDKCHQS